MRITNLRVTNFKNFKDVSIKFENFNILIGANASGKSSFIQIFKFLYDASNHGLNNAISMQGGVEYFRNMNLGTSKNFLIDVSFSLEGMGTLAKNVGKNLIGIKPIEGNYCFSLKFKEREVEVLEDKLVYQCKLEKVKNSKKGMKSEEELGVGSISISQTNGELNYDVQFPEGVNLTKDDLIPSIFKQIEVKPMMILDLPILGPIVASRVFEEIGIYDFDPKLPKKAVPISGKAELEGDGSNLAIVLKNVLENEEDKRKFSNLMSTLLPFVKDVDVEKFADKSFLFTLQESYINGQYLPASLLSDGTINLTALIIALYFEDKGLTIIEEPERNLHPYLISRIIRMMEDASRNKQILISTHNPELVKNANIERILLMTRDKEGFSNICKPTELEHVKIFLEDELGIEELYVQNLLGV